MKKPEDKLVSLTPPAVPIWAVFYDEDEPDHLFILPVLGLAIVELPERGDPGNRTIIPLVFDRLYGIAPDWWEETGSVVLGFVLEEELPKAAEIFAADIARKLRFGVTA